MRTPGTKRKSWMPRCMKKSNFFNYLGVDHTGWTVWYQYLAPPTSGLSWPLTERSDSGSLRTGQNPAGRPIPGLWSEHPHGIYTLVKHVGRSRRFSFLGCFITGVGYSVTNCSKRYKTATFSPNPHIPHFDLNTRMISAH